MISHQISLFEVLGPTRVKAKGFSVWVRGRVSNSFEVEAGTDQVLLGGGPD